MNKLTKAQEKRFDKLELCKCKDGKFCFDTAFELKQFLADELAKKESKMKRIKRSEFIRRREEKNDPLVCSVCGNTKEEGCCLQVHLFRDDCQCLKCVSFRRTIKRIESHIERNEQLLK